LKLIKNEDDLLIRAYERRNEAQERRIQGLNELVDSYRSLCEAKDERIKVLEECLRRYEELIHDVLLHGYPRQSGSVRSGDADCVK